jgi:hypothetical protein
MKRVITNCSQLNYFWQCNLTYFWKVQNTGFEIPYFMQFMPAGTEHVGVVVSLQLLFDLCFVTRLYRLKEKTYSLALSPRAKYTDWATATFRRNLVPTFVDRGVSCGQRGGSPVVVNLSFLDRSRYFSFKWLLIYPRKGWVDPVSDPLSLRKSGNVGNRTRDLWVNSQELWPLDHRGGLSFEGLVFLLSPISKL